MTTVSDGPALSSPYRYLDYFREGDPTFAGRDEDVAEVVARASASEPFVLYGRSGLGKTSLLLAGVFPVLKERGLLPLYVRVFHTPLVDLRNAMAELLKRECRADAGDLLELARAASRSAGLVLVFDQFEEMFLSTRKAPGVRREFVQAMTALLNDPHSDVRLTFSLREDYLAELDDFRETFPNLLANHYRLRPLTAFGARQAITAPLVFAGISFDQSLVVRLVDLLADEDFDPLLLQIACGEVYSEARKRQANVHLTEADLESVGNLDALFTRYLNQAIAAMTEEDASQLLLSRAVLDALVTPEETKRAVRLEDLRSNDDFRASAEEIQSVLDSLERHKVIRKDFRSEEVWYELRHDRLAPSVVRWFKSDSDFSQFRDARNLIADAARRAMYPEKLATLLSLSQLSLIEPYRERLRLTPKQRELMFWSAVHSCVDDVSYWAEMFGRDRCGDVLLALLRHEEEAARRGAATAAERLALEVTDLPAACVKAALEDRNPDVRRAAARALAKLAGPAELDVLRQALRSRRSHSRALDVLAAIDEPNARLTSFGRGWRMLARRRARRLALARYRDAIVERTRRGALVGAAVAVGTSASVGTLIVWLTLWTRGTIAWFNASISQISVGVIGTTILGAAWGWWLGRSSASRAAARGTEGAVGRAVLTPLLLSVAALVVLALNGSDMVNTVALYVTAPIFLVAATAIYVRLFRSAFWPPTGNRRERIVFAWLLALPAATLVGRYAVSNVASPFEGEFFLMVALVSLPTITALILTETANAVPIGPFRPPWTRARIITRGVLALSLAAAPVLFVRWLGVDSIPPLAHTYRANARLEIPVRFRSEGIDSEYFKLEVFNQDVPWLDVQIPPHSSLRTGPADVVPATNAGEMAREMLLFVPPGTHLMSLSRDNAGSGTVHPIHVAPIPVLDERTPVSLTDDGSHFLLRLEEQTSAGERDRGRTSAPAARTWRAVVPVHLMAPLPAPDRIVRLSVLTGEQFAGGNLIQTSERGPDPSSAVVYSPALPLTSIVLQAQNGEASPQSPQLRSLKIEPDGHFTVGLTYELSPDQAAAAKARGDALGPVLHVPVRLSLGAPEFVERLLAGQSPEQVLEDIRQRTDVWNDVAALRQVVDSFVRRSPEGGGGPVARGTRRRILELEPASDAEAFNALAWDYVTANEGAQAVDLARQAVKLSDAKDFRSLDTLAHAEFAAGNWAEAVNAWERVNRLEPGYLKSPSDPFCSQDAAKLEQARSSIGR